MFYIALYRENMKKSSCLKSQALILGISYVASPSRLLPSLFKLCHWDLKWTNPRGHIFYIGLYEGNMKKYPSLKPQGIGL